MGRFWADPRGSPFDEGDVRRAVWIVLQSLNNAFHTSIADDANTSLVSTAAMPSRHSAQIVSAARASFGLCQMPHRLALVQFWSVR